MAERILKLKTTHGINWQCNTWQPMGDNVFIERLESLNRAGSLILPDMRVNNEMQIRKGKVLSCGPKAEAVKPGDIVLFNARWNDLAHAELKPIGSDAKSRTAPLERPLSYRFDPTIHLVQEADIAGVLHET